MDLEKNKTYIVYDGDCYFCSSYVDFVKVKGKYGNVELVNARDSKNSLIKSVKKKYNLNDGFVVIKNNNMFYAADAIQVLSLDLEKKSVLAKINYCLFSSKKLSRFLYPILTFFRRIYLFLFLKKKIK